MRLQGRTDRLTHLRRLRAPWASPRRRLALAALCLLPAAESRAAELSVVDTLIRPGTTADLAVSGVISGESTFGVTILLEIRARAGNTGTVTFTAAPPTDIVQVVPDPWAGDGTYSRFDTDLTGSLSLNGAIDDNGTFEPGALTFSGQLSLFPVVASADAVGVWDVTLSISAGDSSWAGPPTTTTTLFAGTISVVEGECIVDTDCNDNVACTNDTCVAASCVFTPSDANCVDDGVFCNGPEVCGATFGCGSAGNPCQVNEFCNETTDACDQCQVAADCNDGVACTDDTCVSGTCTFTANDANCPDDGLFCNGVEFCDAALDCTSAGDPCSPQVCDEATDSCTGCVDNAECDDGNVCTDDVCNAALCERTSNVAACDDGLFCTAIDVCNGGVCTGSGDPCQSGQLCDEAADACVAPFATLSASSLEIPFGGSGSVVVSGAIDGFDTFGVTLFVELVPRAGSSGALTFTPAPPNDITQADDPWPGAGTFNAFDTDATGSAVLNGSVDEDGSFVPRPVSFSGPLASFPVVASADAGGVWDVVLSTTAGDSGWAGEAVATTLTGGTITVNPAVSLRAESFLMPPAASKSLAVTGQISGQSAFGITILLALTPRAGNIGTLTFTPAPPVDIVQLDDAWPGLGFFMPFDTDSSGSATLNGSIDDSGAIAESVIFSGPLTSFPVVASADADGVWDVELRTSAGDSRWEGATAVLINGTVNVTASACLIDIDCDDANSCTADVCEAGICGYTTVVGACNDGDLCTIDDTCSGMTCIGTPMDCTTLDDACNVGTCNATAGTCEAIATNEGGTCDDGDPCTETDLCTAGVCGGTSILGCINCATVVECDDANVCSDDACVGGACQYVDNTTACDDGDACTTGDTCATGLCVGGAPPVCDDGDVCTDDSCDSLLGCQFVNNTAPCGDSDLCTESDVCTLGACVGVPIAGCVRCWRDWECNDGNNCTGETCGLGVCQFTNLTDPCDDADACTLNDTCTNGACLGAPKDCTALSDTCNTGSCAPATGICVSTAVNEGGVCDDGLACTVSDVCVSGDCSGTLTSTPAVDLAWAPSSTSVQVGETFQIALRASSTTCTIMPVGSIEAVLRWDPNVFELVGMIPPSPSPWTILSGFPNDAALDGLNDPYTGLPASDGDAQWQGVASYIKGAAVPPSGMVATTFEFVALDGSFGTNVWLEPVLGTYSHTRVLGAAEYQGVDLTGALPTVTVQASECQLNADCDDLNVCTDDVCNGGVCEYTNNIVPCGDGLFCTATDVCAGGVCVGSVNPCTAPDLCSEALDACVECLVVAECADANICTTDACDATGTCVYVNNSLPCDDGLFCTDVDACSGGLCVGGIDDPCAALVCDEAGSRCVECLADAHCDDGNSCTDDVCTANSCGNPPNSLPCEDGLFCTTNDVCSGGTCVGGPDPCVPTALCDENSSSCVDCLTSADCDDGNVCTTDTCLFGFCANDNNTLPCDDGDFCSANDVCSAGFCVGSGDPCPGQLCDEGGDRCAECFTVADCSADGVACTADQCTDGLCAYVPADAVCDDGVFCNGAETCDVVLGCLAWSNPCDDPALCDEAGGFCACQTPDVLEEGSRYFAVTPKPGQTPVALRVTGISAEVGCVNQYVQNNGTLGAAPVYKVPGGPLGWGTVHVRGVKLIPDAVYEIRAECDTGVAIRESDAVIALTWLWGDTDNSGGLVDVIDMLNVVNGFLHTFRDATLYSTDLWGVEAGACLPQLVIDVMDMLRVVDAFEQKSFPCGTTCP